jgi:hypothetical protein
MVESGTDLVPHGMRTMSMPPDYPHSETTQPWEDAGSFRRDCLPDRGALLDWLTLPGILTGYGSAVGMVMSASAAHDDRDIPFAAVVIAISILTLVSLLGLLFSLVGWWLAANDLREIDAELRDPAAKAKTTTIFKRGRACTIINGLVVIGGSIAVVLSLLWS